MVSLVTAMSRSVHEVYMDFLRRKGKLCIRKRVKSIEYKPIFGDRYCVPLHDYDSDCIHLAYGIFGSTDD